MDAAIAGLDDLDRDPEVQQTPTIQSATWADAEAAPALEEEAEIKPVAQRQSVNLKGQLDADLTNILMSN